MMKNKIPISSLSLHADESGLSVAGLSDRHTGLNWIQEPVRQLWPTEVELDGRRTAITWHKRSETPFINASGHGCSLIYSSSSPALQIESLWTAIKNGGPVRHALSITNNSTSPVTIFHVNTIRLTVQPVPGLRHLWVEKGSGCPTDSGTHLTDINSGFSFERHSGVHAPAGEDAVPWQLLHDSRNNCGIFAGFESSACTNISLTPSPDSNSLELAMGIENKKNAFSTLIPPGETYPLPPVFIGAFAGSVDDGCAALHDWLRDHVCPKPPSDARFPMIMNNTWGVGWGIDEKTARLMIDECAELGMEAIDIDAGWFQHLGHWENDPSKFPSGIPALVEYATGKGVRIGLWFAWSQGGAVDPEQQGLSAFAPEKREWFAYIHPDEWRANWPWEGVPVCLAHQPAAEWCLNEMRRVLRKTGINMLKHDQCTLTEACAHTSHNHTKSTGDISRRQELQYIRIQNTLRREFPDMIFENCLCAGRVQDFSTLALTHYCLAADRYEPMANRRVFYDLSHPFPAHTIGLYIGAAETQVTVEQFAYRIRSAMLGWPLIMQNTALWSPEQKVCAKRLFDIFKTRLRPIIADGHVFHIGTRPAPDSWDATMYMDRNGHSGFIAVFRADSDQPVHNLILAGLDARTGYTLSFCDKTNPDITASGSTLMNQGISIKLPCKQSSDWIFIKRN